MFVTAVGAFVFCVVIVALAGLCIACSRCGWLRKIQDALGFGEKPEWM